MEEIWSYFKKNKIIVLSMAVVLSLGIGYFLLNSKTKPQKSEPKIEQVAVKKSVSADKVKEKQAENKQLVVDVQGAVKKPGVYRAKKDTIVQEILQMAGGVSEQADIKQLNQAQRITDQMQIYVPTVGEAVHNNATGNQGSTNSKEKIVNINTAKVDDFKSVTGIGPKKAEKIIAYRQKNGNFKTLHDLTGVSGIGEKSLEKLKDQLTV